MRRPYLLILLVKNCSGFKVILIPQKGDIQRDTCDFIERYLTQFRGQLEQTELHNSIRDRQDRRHCSWEKIIWWTVGEWQQYKGYGLEIPDILNASMLRTFQEWDFDLKILPNIKKRKIFANYPIPKKCKKKTKTIIMVDNDLKLDLQGESSDLDERMTAVD
ncbi:hypothetical protein TREES_T100003143 [Tupaia chinensis]|uniref:Translation machinery-associated protein 16 n=1 Tax=Tupaia chinensis TaxID=246437 RepID=L9KHY4_TUPCH|nr:hypothetical protein TREES_T100003144 [Tupaia chinensis]ELW62303.1 hypothetical protein TREES_T100003143 [Tupaia chinensis]